MFFIIVLVLTLHQIDVGAIIVLSNFKNPTYVSKGSDLNIPWTFTDDESNLSQRKWFFNNGSAPDFKTLGSITGDGNYEVNPNSPFTTEVKKPATLSIKNVNLHHNGTYRFEIASKFGTNPDPSDVVVIVTESAATSAITTMPPTTTSGGINILPNFGNSTYVSKGSDLNIPWTFTDDESNLSQRKWYFNNGSAPDFETLGSITGDGNYDVNPSSPFATEVKKPATLSIKNANLHHNGTYRFEISLKFGTNPDPSDVLVIITEQPAAVTNCNQMRTVNEGESFTCLCEGKGGNPPPIASWIRKGKTVASGYLKAILSLKNVQRTDAGSYTCKVASHDLTNEIVVKLKVNFAPKQDDINFPVEGSTVAVLNKQFTITCDAEGSPKPTYKLFHHCCELTVGDTGGKYTINSVSYSDAGEYKCVAANSVDGANKSFTLTVTDTETTEPPTTTSTNSGGTASSSRGTSGSEWYIVIVALIGGIVIGMVLMYGILFLRHRGNKNEGDVQRSVPCRNDECRGEENIPDYQELDDTKRDAGDNYQSLRMTRRNPGSNETRVENEAGYQELNKVRENLDDNYQSLNPRILNTS